MSFVGRVLIPAPHGQLEAIYKPPTETAERVALVLHPHPLHGGTMHNKVVYRTAKALEQVGFVTLRFNFRGVGGSTGTYDRVRGGVEDARTALDFLLADQPRAGRVLVAGFSFGAAVAIRFGCADARVQRVISIGTPASWLDANLLSGCATPIAFVHGERDTVAPLAALQQLLAASGRPGSAVHAIAEADHFFGTALDVLQEAIERVVR